MSLLNSRRCVFCGGAPDEKTREHILPDWLLEHTGNPSRVVTLGLDYSRDQKPIRFSWSNYVAPACKDCNKSFSDLENKVKHILIQLEARHSISVEEYSVLMDWLDKVRTGVWLMRHLIENHPTEIEPNFYITSRIAAKDRMLAMYICAPQQRGISLIGSDSAIFNHMPSCLGIRINDILFLSLSSDFFCSKGCGLPYPQFKKLIMGGKDNGKLRLDGVSGPHEPHDPITPLRLLKPVVWLYQAIKLPVSDPKFQGGYYGHLDPSDMRIQRVTLGRSGRFGAMFRQYANKIEMHQNFRSKIDLDEVTGKDSAPMKYIAATVYDAQAYLYKNLEREWIDPPQATEEFISYRRSLVENAEHIAALYRAQ